MSIMDRFTSTRILRILVAVNENFATCPFFVTVVYKENLTLYDRKKTQKKFLPQSLTYCKTYVL